MDYNSVYIEIQSVFTMTMLISFSLDQKPLSAIVSINKAPLLI
jgi:hypothetical protein